MKGLEVTNPSYAHNALVLNQVIKTKELNMRKQAKRLVKKKAKSAEDKKWAAQHKKWAEESKKRLRETEEKFSDILPEEVYFFLVEQGYSPCDMGWDIQEAIDFVFNSENGLLAPFAVYAMKQLAFAMCEYESMIGHLRSTDA